MLLRRRDDDPHLLEVELTHAEFDDIKSDEDPDVNDFTRTYRLELFRAMIGLPAPITVRIVVAVDRSQMLGRTAEVAAALGASMGKLIIQGRATPDHWHEGREVGPKDLPDIAKGYAVREATEVMWEEL